MLHNRRDLVVLTNSLPFEWSGSGWAMTPDGLLAALAPILRNRHGVWIGHHEAAQFLDPSELEGLTIVALAVDPDEFSLHSDGFSASTLWPLYHDIVVPAEFDRAWWTAYRSVNARFAQAADDAAAYGATVWVHDYQLQLVPEMLRSRRPDLRIGFFNHVPFPPKELFAQLPSREAIVRGMLCADVIGFQLISDVQNFRNAAMNFSDIDVDRSGPVLSAFPMSVDAPAIHRCAESAMAQLETRELRVQFGGPQVLLVGIDRLEHTKGILRRLSAYEELLEERALDPRTTTFVQIAVPTHDRSTAQKRLREEIERYVGRINGRFGTLETTAVHYCCRSYSFESLVALYLAADVLIATSLREGMNLAAKGYVAARRGRGGALILSEFAGSATELTSAFVVNPHDIDALKHAICEAVRMPAGAAHHRMDAMADVVDSYDAHRWAECFLQVLEPEDNIDSPLSRTRNQHSQHESQDVHTAQ